MNRSLLTVGGVTLLGLVLVGIWLGLGLFVARGPQPEIIVPAEKLFAIGPLNVTNTLLTAWCVMAFLIILSLVATRGMKLLPAGVQNFVEASIEFLYDQVVDIAGEKNGRRFFAVVATIFLFIIVANWSGLLPFFNAIGKTEDVGHHVFHEISDHEAEQHAFTEKEDFAAQIFDQGGSFNYVNRNAKAVDFEIPAGTPAPDALDRFIVFLAETFTDFELPEDQPEDAQPTAEQVKAAAAALEADPAAPKLLLASTGGSEGESHDESTESSGEAPDEEAHGVASPALGVTVTGVDYPEQFLGLVIPYFRSVYSDVNNTLALGIIAFVMIEFWGLQTLGFAYLGKFFVNPFRNPIGTFVGFLELLSEFIRIISFTFRLFGNIFAGEVLILMLTFLMPFLLVDIIYGLELFVGFIQAAVFALLTLVFATMAVEHHGDEHHEGHEDEDGSADAHHHEGAAQA